MQRHQYTASALLFAGLIVSVIASREFLSMYAPDPVFPSDHCSSQRMLSDYSSGIRGTAGDTPGYIFDSGEAGATILLLGGTHPNETAGSIAATIVTENARPVKGRLIVVPQACASGFTATDPLEGFPTHFTLTTKSGERTFRFGSRGGNPIHQWPDPLVYRHYPSGQQLSGLESRNLNRSYPGKEDGTFMQQVGHAFVRLIEQEKVDVAFDLHEAAPEVMIINAIITHEKGNDIA
ncbi:MAG: succinylglutamate desuccinylase/aspartoacylase family protein, partial [Bacteroidetes bacterium]|nr:succinylglutamate desuccinylase/aspartoacylase family protein [Bacteroidota bacterium]